MQDLIVRSCSKSEWTGMFYFWQVVLRFLPCVVHITGPGVQGSLGFPRKKFNSRWREEDRKSDLSIATKEVKGQSQDFPEATEWSGEQQETLGSFFIGGVCMLIRKVVYSWGSWPISLSQITVNQVLLLGHCFPQFSWRVCKAGGCSKLQH